jgi:hypothetical protein
MNAGNWDALSAVTARQRRRARLRSATVAVGAAGLVAAGVVGYTLSGQATQPATSTSAAGTATTGGGAATAHATSGGSGTTGAAASSSSSTGATASSSGTGPASSSGASHTVSGGS